ncbi:MAG TPA: hypothetical protein VNK24_03470 [Elusimicrobiota bacterium]|nr:hypothetical protein [Elusimicrobiota bacterium]
MNERTGARARRIAAVLSAAALFVAAGPAKAALPESFLAELGAAQTRFLTESKTLTALQGNPVTPGPVELPLKDGTWRADVDWSSDPEDGEDVLAAHLAFTPDAAAPVCRSIRIIQVANMQVSPGKPYQWLALSGETDRNLTRTPAGYYVDHEAANCSKGKPCSPYYRDSWALPDESHDGQNLPGHVVSSSIADYPFGWGNFDRISLETCARCVDNGQFLGCATWGAFWPLIGNRPPPFTSAAANVPSASFMAALRLFDSFYGMPKP